MPRARGALNDTAAHGAGGVAPAERPPDCGPDLETVKVRHPRIPRRTVYRVLDTLAELGLIRRVHHPGAAARFDAKTHRHHHLVCIRCNKIVDWEMPTWIASRCPRASRTDLTFAIFPFSSWEFARRAGKKRRSRAVLRRSVLWRGPIRRFTSFDRGLAGSSSLTKRRRDPTKENEYE